MGIFSSVGPWGYKCKDNQSEREALYYAILLDHCALRQPQVGKGVRLVTQKLGWAMEQEYGQLNREDRERARTNSENGAEHAVTDLVRYARNMAERISRIRNMLDKYPLSAEESAYFQIEAHIYRAFAASYTGDIDSSLFYMDRAKSTLRALLDTGTTLFPTVMTPVKFEKGRWQRVTA